MPLIYPIHVTLCSDLSLYIRTYIATHGQMNRVQYILFVLVQVNLFREYHGCSPVLFNPYYGINTNCYDLCNIRQPVVYSVEGVIKRGSNHASAPVSIMMQVGVKGEWHVYKLTWSIHKTNIIFFFMLIRDGTNMIDHLVKLDFSIVAPAHHDGTIQLSPHAHTIPLMQPNYICVITC